MELDWRAYPFRVPKAVERQLQSMIGFGHHVGVPLPDAIFHVYASKRRAEVAPGVGQDTDLVIIYPDGVQALKAERLKELQEIYEEHQQSSAHLGHLYAGTSSSARSAEPNSSRAP